jgi:hypothetical protein
VKKSYLRMCELDGRRLQKRRSLLYDVLGHVQVRNEIQPLIRFFIKHAHRTENFGIEIRLYNLIC